MGGLHGQALVAVSTVQVLVYKHSQFVVWKADTRETNYLAHLYFLCHAKLSTYQTNIFYLISIWRPDQRRMNTETNRLKKLEQSYVAGAYVTVKNLFRSSSYGPIAPITDIVLMTEVAWVNPTAKNGLKNVKNSCMCMDGSRVREHSLLLISRNE